MTMNDLGAFLSKTTISQVLQEMKRGTVDKQFLLVVVWASSCSLVLHKGKCSLENFSNQLALAGITGDNNSMIFQICSQFHDVPHIQLLDTELFYCVFILFISHDLQMYLTSKQLYRVAHMLRTAMRVCLPPGNPIIFCKVKFIKMASVKRSIEMENSTN